MPSIFHTNKQRLPRRKRSRRRAVRRMGGSKKDEPVKMTLLKKADGKNDRAKVDAFFASSKAERIAQISTIAPETLERYVNMWKSMKQDKFYDNLESFLTKKNVKIPTYKQSDTKNKNISPAQFVELIKNGSMKKVKLIMLPYKVLFSKYVSQYKCVYYTFWSHFLKECEKVKDCKKQTA